MNDLLSLLVSRYHSLRNQIHFILTRSQLKTIVILLATIGFWLSLYRIFFWGFRFLENYPDIVDWLMEYLFALFFFALTLMLTISNAIISFSSLYKARETAFLITQPVRAGSLLLYRLLESIGFSSWAFLFLGTPLVVAYGVNRHLPLSFYLISLLLFIIFILLPAGLGALISMFLATFMPRRKKQILIGVIILGLIIGTIILFQLADLRKLALPFTARWMQTFLGNLSFCQNPLLPSYWLMRGVMETARYNFTDTLFFALLILSWGLFITWLAYHFANKWYLASYSRSQSSRIQRKYPIKGWLDRIFSTVFFFLKIPTRLIILKDLKTFLRDPVQWTQFLIFFGLLGVYFLNIKNLPYINITKGFWQYLVSFLNLIATSLTLATLTTRFIYPQLSLEGQRFWIIGMMPIKRETIFYGKFFFAAGGALLVSELLIFISTRMLEVPWHLTVIQLYTVLIIALGLASIAVGLGAIYPNLREDNPSKIVAGFGGTLTLVLSLCAVLSIVVIIALPCHLHYVFGRLDEPTFQHWLTINIIIATLIGLGFIFIPLHFGLKALRRLEV